MQENYSNTIKLGCWANAYGQAKASGKIKQHPEDFIVRENLAFTPSGDGEHVFLHIEKKGENTEYLASQLARLAGVRRRDVGYAGLKDRHAVTSQWFSIWLPKHVDVNWTRIENENVSILETTRHNRKLKRGALVGNAFNIRIRNYAGQDQQTQAKLDLICTLGFPNYFGLQRFGRQGNNLQKALEMHEQGTLPKRNASIYISAVRSFLFNEILSQRVKQQTWNTLLPGDYCMLNNSKAGFWSETVDQALMDRLKSGDIHPAGKLLGATDVESIKDKLAADYQPLTRIITSLKMETGFRALRAIPGEFSWRFSGENELSLSFTLPAGTFATSLLREVIQIKE